MLLTIAHVLTVSWTLNIYLMSSEKNISLDIKLGIETYMLMYLY